ncbi:MAG: hypothetical protein Q9195_008881 [Heterodermia aff. obscurata]
MSETEIDLSEWIQPDFLKSPSPQLNPLREEACVFESYVSNEHEQPSAPQVIDQITSQELEQFLGRANRSPTDPENPTLSSDSSALTIIDDQDEPRAPDRPRRRPAKSARNTGRHQATSQKKRSRPDAAGSDPGSSTTTFYNASMLTQGMLPKEERKRRKMDQEGDNYRAVRQRGSCPGCWMQKIKCNEMATRFVDVYKERGSIQSWDLSESPKVIELWHGLNDTSVQITVSKYIPREIIQDLFWKEPNGWQQLEHTPYGIRNEKKDLDPKALDDYVWGQVPYVLNQIDEKESNRTEALGNVALEERSSRPSHKVWLNTMRSIYNYLCDYLQSDVAEIRLLRTSLILWTYTFLQYHGLWQFRPAPNHDNLGMRKLGLHNKDTETLTPFEGTIPLPRLLSQQLHSCIEGRMHVLETSLIRDLHAAYRGPSYNWPVLYLSTWVYLTILEEIVWDAGRWNHLSQWFDWPLEDSPDKTKARAEQSAKVVVAHYQHAFRKKPLPEMYRRVFETRESAPLQQPQDDVNSQSLKDLLKETCSFAITEKPSVDQKLAADFDKDDIRSLELKFAGMLIV